MYGGLKKTAGYMFGLITSLFVLMGTFMIPVCVVNAADESVTDDGWKYIVEEDGFATITGYTGNGTELSVPGSITISDGESPVVATVTKIGYSAFYNNATINNITIPEGVSKIGNNAFSGCRGLSAITIPASVTEIGTDCFRECEGLGSITFAEGIKITAIQNETFENCSNLKSITIPDGVTSIGKDAFYECKKLSTVLLPEGLVSIGADAFYRCEELKAVSFPASLKTIGTGAFCNCIALGKANMDSCTSGGVTIGSNAWASSGAFEYCSSLEEATVINYATLLGEGSFSDTAITSVVIPDGITIIGEDCFEGCKKLQNVTIPEGVTQIGSGAFASTGITSLILPASVTEFESNPWYGCDDLTSIIVAPANTIFDSRDGCNAIIRKSDNTLVVGCKNSVIPTSVEVIGESSFMSCSGIEEIRYAAGTLKLKKIENQAFAYCDNLKTAVIPDGVKELTGQPFRYCEKLETIELPDGLTLLEDNFSQCYSLKALKIPYGIETAYGVAYCTACKSITVPSSVTKISSGFSYQSGVTDIYYQGTKEMWDDLEVYGGNDNLDSISLHFIEGDIQISKAVVNGVQSAYDYTGSAITPAVSITYKDITLKLNRDYEVIYSDNINKGTAKITINGKGSFTGSVNRTFTIGEGNGSGGEGSGDAGEKQGSDPNASDKDSSDKDSSGKDASDTKTPAAAGTAVANKNSADKSVYKVVSADAANPTVEFSGISSNGKAVITIPDTITDANGIVYKVTKIADNALSGNKKITSVTIGKNITEIGKNAFKNCPKLKKVTSKSSSITKIGDGAFSGDKVLKSVDFSKSPIKTIEKNAFSGCKKLTTVKINGNKIKSIGKNAFKNIKKNATITIVTKKKTVYKKVVNLIKKSGAKKVKYKYKKK